MTPEEIVAAAKRVLDAQVKTIPMPGVTAERGEAVEKLVMTVAAFFSMDDAKLRDAIIGEAQNRLVLAGICGKKPWEMP